MLSFLEGVPGILAAGLHRLRSFVCSVRQLTLHAPCEAVLAALPLTRSPVSLLQATPNGQRHLLLPLLSLCMLAHAFRCFVLFLCLEAIAATSVWCAHQKNPEVTSIEFLVL